MSSQPADLAIARFAIEEVVGGTQTGRDGGTLHLSLPELAVGAGEPALAEATVDIVRPGDRVRIANVLDAVVPAVAPDDPASTFPGALGTLVPAGRGRRNVLDGVHVLVCCDWAAAGFAEAEEFPPSFVDMSGPAVEWSPYARSWNVVLTCRPASGATVVEADRAVRRTALRLARDLAATTIGHDAEAVERLSGADGAPIDLPSIAAVLQVASEGALLDTYLYGAPLAGLVPTLLDPLEVLDGALVNGTYDWASVRNTTATYQRSPLLRELLAASGDRLRLAGLILALGYLNTAQDKERSALQTARLARLIGADAAICTTFSSGNSHTDTMLTVRALERIGIRTCAIVAETNGGLTDHVREADCIVSSGNEDALLEPWTPERVIGSPDDAMAGKRVPLSAYLGANDETGAFDLTAVAA